MKRRTIMLILLTLALVGLPVAVRSAPLPCGRALDQQAGLVLCCCPTWNGGQCCASVSYCGSFIPGCFCS